MKIPFLVACICLAAALITNGCSSQSVTNATNSAISTASNVASKAVSAGSSTGSQAKTLVQPTVAKADKAIHSGVGYVKSEAKSVNTAKISQATKITLAKAALVTAHGAAVVSHSLTKTAYNLEGKSSS